MSDAVDARQELDLRLGAAFTRLQTIMLQRKFGWISSAKLLISYGPCQIPTLGFIVQRYLDRINFVPEEFWAISVKITKGSLHADFRWNRKRLFDLLSCLILYEICLESPEARIIRSDRKPIKKYKPGPLNTVSLQKLASKKLRMTSEKVMQLAERLYQNGFLSYPRTETEIYHPTTEFRSLIKEQTNSHQWGNYASGLLGPDAFSPPRNGSKNDNSHPPIHPTKFAASLQPDEKRLYELIVRHFLAQCSQDAEGFETIVEIDIAGELFHCKGLAVSQKNWLEVYPYDKWVDKSLPTFELNEKITPDEILMLDSKTEAPELLTEAELIGLMDKHGIG